MSLPLCLLRRFLLSVGIMGLARDVERISRGKMFHRRAQIQAWTARKLHVTSPLRIIALLIFISLIVVPLIIR